MHVCSLPLSCHSSIKSLLATGSQLSVNLSVSRENAASLPSYIRWFIHSFSKYSTQPGFIAPRLCAKSSGGC